MSILAATAPTGTARYRVLVVTDDDEVRAAQRLRHRVFAEELGATLRSAVPGHDIDEYDAHCDHLIIREESTGAVVGTYRMLPPGRVDRLYTDGEFDLTALKPLREDLVEIGRACVDPAHRTGAVVNLMWAGITRYLHLRDRRWLIGCASVPPADAAAVWHQAKARHLAPPALWARPRRPFPIGPVPERPVAVPPLLRGYLRLGAWVCGPPAHDPDFGVADLPVLMSMDRMDPRYLRHFLGQ